MNRSERIGKIREPLIKRCDEVFEAHRLSDEARRILSDHVSSLKKRRIRRLSPMFWHCWMKGS